MSKLSVVDALTLLNFIGSTLGDAGTSEKDTLLHTLTNTKQQNLKI